MCVLLYMLHAITPITQYTSMRLWVNSMCIHVVVSFLFCFVTLAEETYACVTWVVFEGVVYVWN